MTDLKSLTLPEMTAFLQSLGEPAFRGRQVFTWLHRGVTDFDGMTNLSKSLREKLKETCFITAPQVARKQVSRLDGTIKYLWELSDGNCIETVLMQYHHGNTVCISSQVGCRMGCAFCASTIAGKVRDLTPAEMLDQVLFTQKDSGLPVSNIVLMGIGEPLDNLDTVLKFLELVNHPDGLNIGMRHISLSTWFRDYLYIPLGGSRVGRIRRYFNVMITFLLSGLWHGANWTYVIWGGLNGLFQIAGNVKNTLLSRLPATLKDGRPVVNRDCFSYRLFQRLMTFALICLTWVFFRAESLEAAMIVLRQMVSVHNPWIFFDETLYTLGLSRLELGLLVASAAVVLAVDVAHEHGVTLRKRLERQNLAFRWLAYLAAILCILIFGVYGPGFDASQFIYFQF